MKKTLNSVLEGFNESQSETLPFNPEELQKLCCVQTAKDTTVTPCSAASFAKPEDEAEPLDSQDTTAPLAGGEEKDACVRRPLRRGISRNGSSHRSMSFRSLLISMPSLSSMTEDSLMSEEGSQ
jgi:hypothetical protein